MSVERWALGFGHWALGLKHWAMCFERLALGVEQWALSVERWALSLSDERSVVTAPYCAGHLSAVASVA